MKHISLFSVVLILGWLPSAMGDDDGADKSSDGKTDTGEAFVFDNATFEAPLMLMAGDEPMKAGHSYPSPAMFDVDNDGEIEMVLGEIIGTVSFCENLNDTDGDPVWSAVKPVLTAEGEPLKLHNW